MDRNDKKVFISQPMTGIDEEEINKTRLNAERFLRKRGYKIIPRIEAGDGVVIIHTSRLKPDVDHPIYRLGIDLFALSEADAIFFCDGWEESKGCGVEYAVAKLYGLEILKKRTLKEEKTMGEKKKAMLSQPMAGKTDEEIVATRERAVKYLEENGYEVINTLFTDEWYSSEKMKERGVVQIPLCFLAKSLENMSLCHVAFFCDGWEKARGCKIEHDAAVAYGLETIYESDLDSDKED